MSETVHYKGKIELIKKERYEGLEDVCERVLREEGYGEPELRYYDTCEEMMYCKLHEKYIIFDDNVYKIISKTNIEEHEIFDIKDNNDGTYDYEIMHCNNYMCLSDEIIEAMNR